MRKPVDAERLRADFGEAFTPLLMDVTDEAAVRRAAEQVESGLGGATLAGLVNNAGIVVAGPLLHLPLAELRRQLEVNLVAQLGVTQAFAALLGVDKRRTGKPGRIVNISSVVGKVAPPFVGAYAASKHALEGMSESLRRELMLYGIDVIVVAPGAVVTPIWDKGREEDLSVYEATEYGPALGRFREYLIGEGKKGLPAARVAEAVYTALTVGYAVVPQSFRNWTLPRLLPKRWVDRAIGKQLGFGKA